MTTMRLVSITEEDIARRTTTRHVARDETPDDDQRGRCHRLKDVAALYRHTTADHPDDRGEEERQQKECSSRHIRKPRTGARLNPGCTLDVGIAEDDVRHRQERRCPAEDLRADGGAEFAQMKNAL